MNVRAYSSLTAISLCLSAGLAAAQTPPAATPAAYGPPLKLALEAAQGTIDTCAKAGFTIAAAVVDSAGAVKVVLSSDGVDPRATESAMKKAMSAVKLGMPTAAALDKAKTDKELADRIANDKTLFVHPGAQLLVVGGKMMGAVGASGAPHGNGDDDKCVAAGIAKIQKLLR